MMPPEKPSVQPPDGTRGFLPRYDIDVTRLQAFGRSVAAGVGVLVFGTVGYMIIERQDPLSALYMTAITVTTVGYREAFPLSEAGKMFTIVIAFAGVGVILLVAGEFGRLVLQADLRQLFGVRRDHSMLKKLNDHIVVAGHGRMGRAVVEVLQDRRVPFVVVESKDANCAHLEEHHIPYVQGDATREAVLREAGVDRAATFLACLADDAHNVFAILLARQLNPKITTIARAVEEGSEERLRLAGADRVINPYRMGGMRLAYTALKPTVMDFIEASLPGTTVDLELAEIVVHPNSDLAGKTLAGAEVRQRFGIIVVALKRGDQSTFNPGPHEQIESGDVLVALGPIQALDRIERASQ
jgi:voltage-gated potassium channel